VVSIKILFLKNIQILSKTMIDCFPESSINPVEDNFYEIDLSEEPTSPEQVKPDKIKEEDNNIMTR
jgi:hypothetical protein